MWDNEVVARANARSQDVWALFEDPSTWVTWDPEVKSASIDGPMQVGAKVSIDPASGPKRTLSVVECDPGRRYCSEDRLPLARMRFCHEVTPTDEGVRIVLTQRIDGPLSWLVARLLGNRIAAGQAQAIKGLVTVAEQGAQRDADPPSPDA